MDLLLLHVLALFLIHAHQEEMTHLTSNFIIFSLRRELVIDVKEDTCHTNISQPEHGQRQGWDDRACESSNRSVQQVVSNLNTLEKT